MASRAASAPSRGSAALQAGDDMAMLPVDNPLLLTVGIMLASLLQILDSTIANVAIPHMQSSLGATPDTISWALTSYIVATAVAMPMTGWLSDRVGSRNLFIWSVAGFILSSMLCGMSQNLTQMVLFRALQGATGAFISPLSQAAMIDTNKPSRQPQMMALWGMGIMVGPILGPFLGGWLTENANWRWVFYVNVPLGAVSLAILLAELPSRVRIRRRFDLTGFGLVAICLASMQMLLDRGNHVDWFDSAESWIYLGVAVSTAWMALIHFATTPHPLFDRGLFANPNFVVAMLIMVVMGVVMFATMALLPPMLQHLFGYTVIDTGEALVPRGVGTLLSMQFAGYLVRRGVDPRMMVILGFSIAAYSLWDMASWSLAVSRETIMLAGLIQGIGMGLVFIPMNAIAFSTLPAQLRTDGASLLNLCRSIGSSIGIAVTTALAARSIQVSHADLASHVTASASSMVDVSAAEKFQAVGETALRMVDAEVNRQAAMIAYVNDFYLMMWLALAAVPLALLLRRQVTGPGR
ncbi:MAG: DHA2 family efflux MFS transporter permease subunit [Sphingomonadaceae bacterium]|nr:DHA2 family efflux MFS transporter permease subunit [Sphingomonadaceae bacterium]